MKLDNAIAKVSNRVLHLWL